MTKFFVYRFIFIDLLNILRRVWAITAASLLLTTVLLSLKAENPILNDLAQEALGQYLAQPTSESLQTLIRDHGSSFVEFKGKQVYVSSFNWNRFLNATDRDIFDDQLKRSQNQLQKQGQPEDALIAGVRHYDATNQAIWAKRRLTHVIESGITPSPVQKNFKPGRKWFTRQIGPRTQAILLGPELYLVDPNSNGSQVTRLDIRSGRQLDSWTINQRILQVSMVDGNAMLIGHSTFVVIEPTARHYQYDARHGFHLAGWPKRLGNIIVAPTMSGDAPCQFELTRWRDSQANPERSWPLFSRHDRKGRLRDQLWLAGPTTTKHSAYITHCGGVLMIDTVNGSPLQWLPYPSLPTDNILARDHSPWSRTMPDRQWSFHPQDSSAVLQMTLPNGKIKVSKPAVSQQRVLVGRSGLAAIEPTELLGQWQISGSFALHRFGNQITVIQHYINDTHPDNLARMGTPPSNHPMARRIAFDRMVQGSSEVDENRLRDYLIDPIREPGSWIPQFWNRASSTNRQQLWNLWLSHRAREPFPFHHRWRLPNAFSHLWLEARHNTLRQPTVVPKEIQQQTGNGPWKLSGILHHEELMLVSDDHAVCVNQAGQKTYLDLTNWVFCDKKQSFKRHTVNPNDLKRLDKAAGNSQRITADAVASFTAALYRRGWTTRLRILDSSGLIWTGDVTLSPESTIRCFDDGIFVVDAIAGRAWVISVTGQTQLSFPLVERGPYQLVVNDQALAVVGPHYLIALHRPNRSHVIRRARAGQPPPWFNFLWDQPGEPSDWSSVTDPQLRRCLIEGLTVFTALNQQVVLRAPRSRLPLRADALLDDPYQKKHQLSWPDWPGASVMALHNDNGLMIAVIVPDKTWKAIREIDGVWTGDLIHCAWDPLSDARWLPERDDRSILAGPIDPNRPGPLKLRELKPGEKPMAGTLATRYDPEKQHHIYELLLTWEDLGHRLPFRMNLAAQDDTGTTRIYRSLRPGMTLGDFIPRLMFEVQASR